jgi:proteasome lid subunit RPN8/RPN11
MTTETLRLRAADWQAMLDHVRRSFPEEACGLLGGPPGRVERVYLVENTLHSPTKYLMDAAQQVRAMIELEAAGWDVCGIFHSHPAGPPWPSASDVAQAYYPEAVYVILAPAERGDWQAHAFRIEGGVVRPVRLEVAEQL